MDDVMPGVAQQLAELRTSLDRIPTTRPDQAELMLQAFAAIATLTGALQSVTYRLAQIQDGLGTPTDLEAIRRTLDSP